MANSKQTRWTILILANVLFCCVLSFYQTTGAAPQNTRQPFANPVVQRNQIISELQGIKTLLKEQNALLLAGDATKTKNVRQNR